MSTRVGPHAERNKLLLALSKGEYQRLLPDLEVVPLPMGSVLYEVDQKICGIYFPQRCVVSALVDGEDDEPAEIQTIGNEGVVGLAVLGTGVAISRTVAQVPDHAVRMSAGAFRRAVGESAVLRTILLRYTEWTLKRLARTGLCYRQHGLEARCARWLLTTQDRVGANRFVLKQELLAQMLGARRPSTTTAAGTLRRAGLIRYSRGVITVMDRPGLEAAACSCYGILRADYERLLGDGAGRQRPAT
jgi:CRP-like cAMP-binding protein